jgi:hypothetical protein
MLLRNEAAVGEKLQNFSLQIAQEDSDSNKQPAKPGGKKMLKSPFSGFGSSRRSMRKVSAFPDYHGAPTDVWKPKLNDRVQIPSGIGTVVEISDGMYLVDLENQLANVWERLTSIRLPK